jgi:hypothetical protein
VGRHWAKRDTKTPVKQARKQAKPVAVVANDDELPRVGNCPLSRAAELLDLCEKTVVTKALAGEFPGRKVAGRWKFPWKWVREMTGAAAG